MATKKGSGVELKYYYDNGCDNIFTLDIGKGIAPCWQKGNPCG